MQQRNFTVVTPFSLQPSPQAGIAVYNGTVSDNNGTNAAGYPTVLVSRCDELSRGYKCKYISVANTAMFMRVVSATVAQRNATKR